VPLLFTLSWCGLQLRAFFDHCIAGRFRFDPHDWIILAADTGDATATARSNSGTLAADAGDNAKCAFALVRPSDTITAFHFFLPPFFLVPFDVMGLGFMLP
jgi:hypothetical protein